VSEFLTLKPVQVSSRVQLSEQYSSEDDDDVMFAVSNAHRTGPFSVALHFSYDVTRTDSSRDSTWTTTCSSSSNRGRNIGINFTYILTVWSQSD